MIFLTIRAVPIPTVMQQVPPPLLERPRKALEDVQHTLSITGTVFGHRIDEVTSIIDLLKQPPLNFPLMSWSGKGSATLLMWACFAIPCFVPFFDVSQQFRYLNVESYENSLSCWQERFLVEEQGLPGFFHVVARFGCKALQCQPHPYVHPCMPGNTLNRHHAGQTRGRCTHGSIKLPIVPLFILVCRC